MTRCERFRAALLLGVASLAGSACAPGGGASARAVSADPIAASAEQQASAEIEARWGFDRTSDYATLVGAIGHIQAAIRQERDVELARRARMLAVSYLAVKDRVRFQAEFVLEQPEYEHKAAGAKFLVAHLQDRKPIEPALKKRIVDRVATDLRTIPGRGAGENEFVGNATLLLALLEEPRALDIVLSDQSTMTRMRRRDGFTLDAEAEVFERLAERYSGPDTEGWLLAHGKLYEMMAARRRTGQPLEPRDPLLDMREYVKLDPVR